MGGLRPALWHRGMRGRALVAWNLRRLRSERGVSQERLAADAGVDRAYLSEIEREQGNVTVDLLDRLAAELDCRPGEFLAEPVQGQEPKKVRSGRKPA